MAEYYLNTAEYYLNTAGRLLRMVERRPAVGEGGGYFRGRSTVPRSEVAYGRAQVGGESAEVSGTVVSG